MAFFVWSPLLLLGFAGLWWFRHSGLRKWIFVAIGLEIVVCAHLLDWWGGRSFGARRLVGVVPFAALGLGLAMQRLSTNPWRRASSRWASWWPVRGTLDSYWRSATH
jgi:hypothetical protein